MNEELALNLQETGLTKMEPLNEVEQLHQWIFEKVKPWVKGKILEIGSGSGELSAFFIRAGIRLRLSDSKREYGHLLKNKFNGKKEVKGIHRVKLNREDFERAYEEVLGKFDTILMLNIVEHEPISWSMAVNAKKLLKEEGHFIVIQPANYALYHELNLGYQAWRNQNHQYLRRLFGKDCQLIAVKFFQVSGVLGGHFSEQKSSDHEEDSMNFYHQRVPVFRIPDELFFQKLGLSMIVVARKSTSKKNK